MMPREAFDRHDADPEWAMTVEELVEMGRPGMREFINLLLDDPIRKYEVVNFMMALYEPYFKEAEEKEAAGG